MPDQGTQRCQDDAGKTCRRSSLSRRLQNKRCHDDYRRTNHVTTTTGEQSMSRRLQENKHCHDDYRRTNHVTTTTGEQTLSRRLQDKKRCHDDYRRTNAVTTTTGEQTLSRRLQENKHCHDDYRRTNAVTTMVRLKTPPEGQHKRRVDASLFLTGSSLHFRYYCWFPTSRATPNVMLLGCALVWVFVVCVLSVHSCHAQPKAVF